MNLLSGVCPERGEGAPDIILGLQGKGQVRQKAKVAAGTKGKICKF